MQQNTSYNWHEYGATGPQRQTASSEDDPHVIIEPIYSGVNMQMVDFVHSPAVRNELELARDVEDGSQDFGVNQYLRVSSRLAQLVAGLDATA